MWPYEFVVNKLNQIQTYVINLVFKLFSKTNATTRHNNIRQQDITASTVSNEINIV